MTNVIDKFIKDMEIRNLATRTKESYLYAVKGLARYYGNCNPRELTDQQVQDYLHHLAVERGCSQTYLRVQAAAFRFFFLTTLRHDTRKFLIPITRRRKSLPEILTRQEVGRLFRAIAYDLRKTAYFALLYGCGLRGTEACRVRRKDLERESNTLWVRDGKGGKDRRVYLPKAVATALVAYWRASHFTDYLFVNPNNPSEPMDIKTPQKWMKTIKREAGIEKKGVLHMLRHSYATHSLEDGEHLLTIQRSLGHSSLKTTLIYLRLARLPEPKQAPIDRLFDSRNRPEDPAW